MNPQAFSSTSDDAPAAWSQRAQQVARWLPFLGASLYSIVSSGVAPDGRKPFTIDWNFDLAAIGFSVSKQPHIGAAAIIALLAMFAVGRHRWVWAALLTVLVGIGWELAQTTVIGHNARLTDLLPDALGALAGCAWGYCVLRLLAPAPSSDGGR